jgi:hypothetical protein
VTINYKLKDKLDHAKIAYMTPTKTFGIAQRSLKHDVPKTE